MQSKKASPLKASKPTKSSGSTQRHRKSSVVVSSEIVTVAQAAALQLAAEAPVGALNKSALNSAPISIPETSVPETTMENIAQLAYSFWQARGHHHGSPEQDWLRAERELGLVG